MVTYDNEFETKGKKIKPRIKLECEQSSFFLRVASSEVRSEMVKRRKDWGRGWKKDDHGGFVF